MGPPVKIEIATREQIAAFLPDAIRLAVESYRGFMQTEQKIINRKDFADHHKSAKVAISHIELLIKLARWADLPDSQLTGGLEGEAFAGLMAAAEAEIRAYQDDEDETPD